jgi:hypothetical protein
VLINVDQPYVNGYKPRQNYQALLEQVVLEYLESDRTLVEEVTPVPALDDVRALMEGGSEVLGWRPAAVTRRCASPSMSHIARSFVARRNCNPRAASRRPSSVIDPPAPPISTIVMTSLLMVTGLLSRRGL